MNGDLPDVEAGLRKDRRTRDQIANIHWIIKKGRVPEKHLLLLNWLCQSPGLCGLQQIGKNKEMGLPDHLICLLRNLYAGRETTVRTGHGITDWFRIRKGAGQAAYCYRACLIYMPSTCWAGWSTSWNQDHQEKYQ